MTAQLARLRSRPEMLQEEEAARLRQLLLAWEQQAPGPVSSLLALIDRHAATINRWTFVMLSPSQNRAVVRWLRQHSRRPGPAGELWAVLFEKLRMDTGEIVATRAELAAEVGCHPNHVSAIFAELQQLGALIRCQDGRTVRWFMNPSIGTCLTGPARERAQAEAPRLQLVPVA